MAPYVGDGAEWSTGKRGDEETGFVLDLLVDIADAGRLQGIKSSRPAEVIGEGNGE